MNTYRITTRDMTGGLVGVILTGFHDGVVANRMNAAVVRPGRLASFVSEMRAGLIYYQPRAWSTRTPPLRLTGRAPSSRSSEGRVMKSSRTFLVTMDGVGLSKPTSVRAKAIRSARWWARRCPGLVEVARLKGLPS